MDDEYVFIPVDLTGIWQGRINAIHIDVCIAGNVRDFDICFAGMFRSVNEACAYASDWLEPICGIGGETSAYPGQDCPGAPTEPPVAEPPYDPPVSTEPPEIGGTIPEEAITEEAITEVISRGEDAPDTEAGETADGDAAVGGSCPSTAVRAAWEPLPCWLSPRRRCSCSKGKNDLRPEK